MTQEQILQQLCEIITVNFGISTEHITPDAAFRANLGMDSLDLVDMTFFINKTFDINEDASQYHDLVTVQDVVTFVHIRTKDNVSS
ncbi:MAG: hypothetical protein CL920_35225 [Deltaproteobacteria bacterium]|mgnify:CR=1 FL=1|nr:hypothetical protein [Deltaproteobacteria bacterium]MBU53976.1 hypothetical protein [Deltaproteobacteria bacterium]|tara:strand:+ start:3836 stop:4093 length:258 start_codon:yes stop_codon:yes gene_type:complete